MRKCGLKMNPLKCVFCVHAGDFLCFVVHKKGIEINPKQDKGYLGDQASFDQKTTSISARKNQLLEKIHFESKWKGSSFLTTTSTQER
jgi:hypothetical protein